MFRTATTVLATALIGAGVNSPVAVAATAATTGTPCIAEWDITISPGVGARPSFGRYGTAGDDGVITCQGPVNGHAATGPGTWGVSGTYGTATEQDDCLGVHGPIRFTFAIPTDAGPQHGSTVGRFDYGLRYGRNPLGGQMDTPLATGSYQFTPLQGDCLTQPLTRGHLRFQFLLTDVAPSRGGSSRSPDSALLAPPSCCPAAVPILNTDAAVDSQRQSASTKADPARH